MSEYADRDIIAQGKDYTRHVSAMTAEQLHAKSDIAAELAHRDIRIRWLEARINEMDSLRARASVRIRELEAENARLRKAFTAAPCERDGMQALCDDCDCWKRAALEGRSHD